jgi:hypothetical protein
MLQGYRLIELWKDGLFIFIAPGDEDFLGWSTHGFEKPIHISNFVLAESVLTFCWPVEVTANVRNVAVVGRGQREAARLNGYDVAHLPAAKDLIGYASRIQEAFAFTEIRERYTSPTGFWS